MDSFEMHNKMPLKLTKMAFLADKNFWSEKTLALYLALTFLSLNLLNKVFVNKIFRTGKQTFFGVELRL